MLILEKNNTVCCSISILCKLPAHLAWSQSRMILYAYSTLHSACLDLMPKPCNCPVWLVDLYINGMLPQPMSILCQNTSEHNKVRQSLAS